MPDQIFAIGSGLKSWENKLAAEGIAVTHFPSAARAMELLGQAAVLIVDRDQRTSLREILRKAKSIPKVVLSQKAASRKLGPWLREPLCYPLHEPEAKDLALFIRRLLKEARTADRICILQDDLATMKEELSFFEEMNTVLTSSRDINDVLVTIMKRVREMTGARAWSILLVDEGTGDILLDNTAGPARRMLRKPRLKPGDGIAGWVAQHGKPLVVPDVNTDPRFSPLVDSHGRLQTKTVMCAPILSKGKPLGVLEVINKRDHGSFTDEDLELLMKLVNQAALAVERMALHQKLEELVVTDDLTKLFNTRYLQRSIDNEVQRSHRYNTSVSLIFMDLDHFKDINDNYGHLAGSKMLVEVGQILIRQLRSIDTVARYGGDEFVIVLPQTALKNAMVIAERMRKAIANHVFLKAEGFDISMTASFGVACYPETSKSKEDLLHIADESMYSVKRRTRNGVYAII